MSFSSRILTACSGFTCGHSTRSTCSSDFSRAHERREIQSEIKQLEERIRRLDKEPYRPIGRGSGLIAPGQP